MAKKRKKNLIPKTLLLFCIVSGVATLVLRMLNRKLQVSELSEISSYIGTAFAISLLVIIGIWVVNLVNKK